MQLVGYIHSGRWSLPFQEKIFQKFVSKALQMMSLAISRREQEVSNKSVLYKYMLWKLGWFELVEGRLFFVWLWMFQLFVRIGIALSKINLSLYTAWSVLGFTYNVVNFENYSTYFGIESQKLLLEAVHILLALKIIHCVLASNILFEHSWFVCRYRIASRTMSNISPCCMTQYI